jgi:hypothetical protein
MRAKIKTAAKSFVHVFLPLPPIKVLVNGHYYLAFGRETPRNKNTPAQVLSHRMG